MILNSGLDAACTNRADSSPGNPSYPYFCRFIAYAAIGTGSTAPSPEQTLLDAQVGSRTANNGGFSSSEAAGIDAGNNLIWFEATFTRVFNITSAVNVTEWGLSTETTGSLSVRDLFREDPNDPDSDPVALSLDDGDQLQLVVTLRVEAPWEYEVKSFVITGTVGNDGVGTHTGNATVTPGASTTGSDIRDAIQAVWPGGSWAGNGGLRVVTSDQSGVAKNQNTSNSAAAVELSAESYTPGSFYRDWTGTFSTSQANGDHYAWFVTNSASGVATSVGYRFILTDPATLTKTNTHRLTLTFRRSIARL